MLGEGLVEVSKSLAEERRELTREEKEEQRKLEQLEGARRRNISSISPPPPPVLKQHEARLYERVGTRHCACRSHRPYRCF
jgi:hypothetical protein